MRIKNEGKKRYYVYQNDKYVGKVTKKHSELTVNNHSPFYIRKTNKILEITYYSVVAILTVVFAIFGRPLLLPLFACAGYIINPFDLTKKTDYYIPKPTGSISLNDEHNFKTNAEVVLRKRGQFIAIRATFVVLFLSVLLELLIESFFVYDLPYTFLIVPGVYLPIYIIFMIFTIKKIRETVKAYKLEREEQDKIIKNII